MFDSPMTEKSFTSNSPNRESESLRFSLEMTNSLSFIRKKQSKCVAMIVAVTVLPLMESVWSVWN